MIKFSKYVFFAATLFSSFLAIGQKTILHCGRLIDAVSNTARADVSVVVEGKKIISVEKGFVAGQADDQVLDLKDKTVMPGLIDLHVHIEGETSPNRYLERFTLNDADKAFRSTVYAKTTLMAGFTTVRDLAGSGVNIALRNAVNRGLVVGPRIFTAGTALTITGGHGDPTNGYRKDLMGDPGPKQGVVNGTDDARKAVRQRYKEGSDLIKIAATGGVLSVAKDGSLPSFTQEEMNVIVATAKNFGMNVAAHAHGAEGMKMAIRAGVQTIEHGTKMDDEVRALMKQYGTYYVPTITAGKSVAELAKIDGYYPELVRPKALELGPQIQATFEKAYKAGVKIAFGTDAAVFKHGENWKEFTYMVEGGMPPMEAIQSATAVASKVLGQDENFGTIETGKLADIIAVDGNPLEDIAVMEKVSFVMKEGKVYKN